MRVVVPIVAALIILLSAASASAAEPASDPEIAAWVQAAKGYWHDSRDPVMVRAEVLPNTPTLTILATAIINGFAFNEPTIALDPDAYPYTRALGLGDRDEWAAQMCAAVAHEYGHLRGLTHTPDKRNLMNEAVPLNIVPGCPQYGTYRTAQLRRVDTPSRDRHPRWIRRGDLVRALRGHAARAAVLP